MGRRGRGPRAGTAAVRRDDSARVSQWLKWGITRLVVGGDERLLRMDISVWGGEAGRDAHDGPLRRAASPRERRIIGLGGCASDWPTVYFENAFSPIKLSAREDFCDRFGVRAGAVRRDSRERAAARARA